MQGMGEHKTGLASMHQQISMRLVRPLSILFLTISELTPGC